MSILIFLIILSVLVFVHELGHFLVAKKNGVKVEEFGFGLPPRLLGRKIGQTLYSINLLPIGGFVKLKGEEGEVAGFGDPDSFASVKPWPRIGIVIAGVLGNLLLAYLIFVLLFLVGSPKISGKVRIDEVAKGSPAEKSQILVGDLVASINGQKVETPDELIETTKQKRGQTLTLALERKEQKIEITITPRLNPPTGQGPLGVRLGFAGGLVYEKVSWYRAPFRAALETVDKLNLMVRGLQRMIAELFVGRAPQDASGVIGIYSIGNQVCRSGFSLCLQFVSIVSLNLMMVNLLPVPALDGGRILFILPEVILRKKVPEKFERLVNNAGLIFLLTIFLLITIRDVQRFILPMF